MPDFRFLDWLLGGFTALLGLLWKMQSTRIDEVHARVASVEGQHRSDINRLFDKLELHATASEKRHIELLHELHIGLNGKVDKK